MKELEDYFLSCYPHATPCLGSKLNVTVDFSHFLKDYEKEHADSDIYAATNVVCKAVDEWRASNGIDFVLLELRLERNLTKSTSAVE